MSPTIRHKCKYFHSTVQGAKDRRQKFHFCRLPSDARPRNVKLNLSIYQPHQTSSRQFVCDVSVFFQTPSLWESISLNFILQIAFFWFCKAVQDPTIRF